MEAFGSWAPKSIAPEYCAMLDHKVNHSVEPNAKFDAFEHPQFGLIPSIVTIVDIQQGEEVS